MKLWSFAAFSRRAVPTDRRTEVSGLTVPANDTVRLSVPILHSAIDAARAGNTSELWGYYSDILLADSHLQTELGKRKLAVLGDRLTVSPYDKLDPADVQLADFIRFQTEDVDGWTESISHLLDSVLWPVSCVEKIYRPDAGRFVIDRLIPVPHYLEDYRTGHLQLRDVQPDGALLSTAHDPDPNRYIIHRGHLVSAPDSFGGPFRSILFWSLFSMMDRDWWSRFLERFGAPFLVGKYDSGRAEDRDLLNTAFKAATRLFGIAVSKDVQIDLKEANTSGGGDAFEKFQAAANREKSKLLLGQTLSSDAQATGLGSGVANLHSDVRDDIRQFDQRTLLRTLRSGLFDQLRQVNGFTGREPKLSWGSASDRQLAARVGLLKDLGIAGLEPDDSALSALGEDLGFSIRRRSIAQGPFPLSATDIYRRSR